jgi:thiamine biosynthesis lipoprotein
MLQKKTVSKLGKNVDRRSFFKACGALGVGAVAGGILQSKFDIVGVGRGLKKVSQSRLAMGTYVTLTAVHESSARAEEAIGRAFDEMDRLIAIFSRFDSASPVSVLNRDGRVDGPPPEMTDVLRWSRHYYDLSGGTFDVTVKPLIDLFSSTVGVDGRTFPRDDQIADALGRVGASEVEVSGKSVRFARSGMGITLDGIAKGYIVDMMSAALFSAGIRNHLINAGGDIRTSGTTVDEESWTIAVEDPEKKRQYPDVIRMTDGAVATSGNYEIFFDKEKIFHHVVDPRTGVSPQYSASVTVRTASVMVADALSTAAFVVAPEDAVRMIESTRPIYHGTGCLVIGSTGELYRSEGWVPASA